jgi:hypothetical protein
VTRDKVTVTQVAAAISLLGELISFFPAGEAARRMIIKEVYRFVGTAEQLEWFVDAAAGHIGKWQGLPDLRAIYNTKFAPDDGVMPTVELKGFSSDELEAKHIAREMQENEARLQFYNRQALLARPKDREPFLLPEPKTMDGLNTNADVVVRQPKRDKPLKELEEELANAPKAPLRSESERDRLVREIQDRLRDEQAEKVQPVDIAEDTPCIDRKARAS